MSAGGSFNNVFEEFGNNEQDAIILTIDISSSDDSAKIVNKYKSSSGVTPKFPIVLTTGNSKALANLFGQPNSGGPTFIMHPDREFDKTSYSETTMKTNLQNALDDDCDQGTTKYTLTVTKGNGSGEYEEDASVPVQADTPQQGFKFEKWIGDTQYVASTGNASTTVTMPGKDISIEATYVDTTVVTYSLTVKNGTGTGNYEEGKDVTVKADIPQDGYVFEVWIGDTEYIANTGSASTTVSMPNKDISIEATYRDTTNSDIDTANPVSIMHYAGWEGGKDEYGSTIDVDTSKLSSDTLVTAKMSLTKSDAAKEEWAWVKLSAYLAADLKGVTAYKVVYKADDSVDLVLDQDDLSAAGTSYFYKLPPTGDTFKTVLLSEKNFKQPTWHKESDALDLEKVKSISFAATKEEDSVSIEIEDVILYNYNPESIISDKQFSNNLLSLNAIGDKVVLYAPESGTYKLRIFGINGKMLLSERVNLHSGLNNITSKIPTAAAVNLMTIESNTSTTTVKFVTH